MASVAWAWHTISHHCESTVGRRSDDVLLFLRSFDRFHRKHNIFSTTLYTPCEFRPTGKEKKAGRVWVCANETSLWFWLFVVLCYVLNSFLFTFRVHGARDFVSMLDNGNERKPKIYYYSIVFSAFCFVVNTAEAPHAGEKGFNTLCTMK